ncbi:NOG: Noggin [Crotalus adamanteus]|uniref:NOG: Noggin n=1 Tax=Crotalus adamanteus TaxID=8729 RepID=A0AAW1BCK7_CROAD
MLLLEQWSQGFHYTGAIFVSQKGGFSLSGVPRPSNNIRALEQPNPDIHLTWSKLQTQARPYSLSLSLEDYHYSVPKPKHLRTSKLMKLLGSSYEPFWMSPEDPRGRNPSTKELSTQNRELTKRTARFRKKLLQETSRDGIARNLSQSFIYHLRGWLVDSATCSLTSSWVDMGSVFWPRWIRHTYCDLMQAGCAWPPGMICQPAQITNIKLMAWHCWINGTQSLNSRKSRRECVWRQIPYPVVTACKCACS